MQLHPGEPDFGPWEVVDIQSLLASWQAKLPNPVEKPGVLAIDGRGLAGKSTLSATISRAVPHSAVVHTDDLAWHHAFFDWADLLRDGVLTPALAGQHVRYRPPAWDQRERPGVIEVPQGCPLIIVEGTGVARTELMPLIDIVIWAQADIEKANVRSITRDGESAEHLAHIEAWMVEELPFLNRERPWERADVIVLGTSDFEYDQTSRVVVSKAAHL